MTFSQLGEYRGKSSLPLYSQVSQQFYRLTQGPTASQVNSKFSLHFCADSYPADKAKQGS